ncbi:UNVERIFIED_CONTAM: NADH-ubiquinone oxidoreductase chain 6 [Trichonephila clavipes]
MNFILDFLALGAIFSGILVIISKNPVISVLFLISVFVFVAGYLVILGVGFIGISYLIVYVGAIAILFLFVIIILNLQLAELSGTEYTQNLPLGFIVGSLFLFELSSNIPKTFIDASLNSIDNITILFNNLSLGIDKTIDIYITFNPISVDITYTNFLQIQSLGQIIYTNAAI